MSDSFAGPEAPSSSETLHLAVVGFAYVGVEVLALAVLQPMSFYVGLDGAYGNQTWLISTLAILFVAAVLSAFATWGIASRADRFVSSSRIGRALAAAVILACTASIFWVATLCLAFADLSIEGDGGALAGSPLWVSMINFILPLPLLLVAGALLLADWRYRGDRGRRIPPLA